MKLSVVLVDFHSGEKIVPLARKLAGFSIVSSIEFISNEPTPGEKKMLSRELGTNKNVQLFFNPLNLGFGKAANIGIQSARTRRADAVLLLNPDIIIGESDIKKLLESPGDIVSPVLKFERLGKTVYDHGGNVVWPLGRTYHLESTEPSAGSGQATRDIDYVSGACMLVKSEVFKKIGFFDERFFMYFEDVDFCLHAKRAGLSVRVQGNVIVEHAISEHRFSINSLKTKYLLRSNRLFIDKWITWFFKPTAYVYWLMLSLKSSVNI